MAISDDFEIEWVDRPIRYSTVLPRYTVRRFYYWLRVTFRRENRQRLAAEMQQRRRHLRQVRRWHRGHMRDQARWVREAT